jgi:hypothetical protein
MWKKSQFFNANHDRYNKYAVSLGVGNSGVGSGDQLQRDHNRHITVTCKLTEIPAGVDRRSQRRSFQYTNALYLSNLEQFPGL